MPFDLVYADNNDCLIGVAEVANVEKHFVHGEPAIAGQHVLPWMYCAPDAVFFNQLTCSTTDKPHIAIVGHNTYKSLPHTFFKRSGRKIIVITRDAINDQLFASDLQTALDLASTIVHEKIYVCGGAKIYAQALKHPELSSIHHTRIESSYPTQNIVAGYVRFPIDITQAGLTIIAQRQQHDRKTNVICTFTEYRAAERLQSIELTDTWMPYIHQDGKDKLYNDYHDDQYLVLLEKLYHNGLRKDGRNGQVSSLFGYQMRYDLSKGFPVCTLKRSYPKSIFEELMWMLRGQTDSKILEKMGINIWKGNSSAEFLANRGLDYREGDIGPGYGFQLRHSGGLYEGCDADYAGVGYDQLAKVIELLNNNPTSRRIVIDLWCPADLDKMALPPCHMIYNFNVDMYPEPIDGKRGKLNCHLFQRSWDTFLGWNHSTAALLTHILATHTDFDVGELVHSITDAHLYMEHVDTGLILDVISRPTRKQPKLSILTKKANIEDYSWADICIEDYYPYPGVSVGMIA